MTILFAPRGGKGSGEGGGEVGGEESISWQGDLSFMSSDKMKERPAASEVKKLRFRKMHTQIRALRTDIAAIGSR